MVEKKDGITYGYELAKETKIPQIENGYYNFYDRASIIMMTQNYLIDIHLISRWQFMMLILIDCIILNLIHKIFDLSLT